jgi:hypothetical protein
LVRELLSGSQIQERVIIESISVEAEDLAGQRGTVPAMERELDHPPPSQLSSTKRMIEVGSVTA